MRIIISVVLATTFTGIVVALFLLYRQRVAIVDETTQSSTPILCRLPEPELRTRRDELVKSLGPRLQRLEEFSSGYRLRFPPDQAGALLELIQFERNCCPFFTFSLTFEEMQGALWFSVSGPEGTKDFLKPLLDALDHSA
jgi:hypothetical protein